MNIYVMDTEKQLLKVEFTEEDLSNSLFDSALSRLRGKKNLEVHKSGEVVTIEPLPDSYGNIGLLVDEVRELFMGDVVPPETVEELEVVKPAVTDVKGKILEAEVTEMVLKEVPKDLSRCPCFTFTATAKEEVMEPVKEEEPIVEEKVDDGSELQESFLEIIRK